MNKRMIFGGIGILLLITMLYVSFTSASTETLKPAKLNQEYTIIQVCSDATYINFSISNLGGLILTNQQMINNGSGVFVYNYTPLEIGRYDISGVSDGCEKTFATYFEVSPAGLVQTTSQGIGSAIFLALMLVLTFLFGWMGFKLSESKSLWILGIFFLFLSVIFIVYDVWLGYEYHLNFTGLGESAMPETIFYIFMFLLIAGLLVSLALLFTRWKELGRYIKSEITKRKEDEEFDKDFE